MVNSLNNLLAMADYSPVLVDIGSAGQRNTIWDPIASQSVMLGFDPDRRNPQGPSGTRYKTTIMVDKAVCPSDDEEELTFVLTEYPSCSSHLEPDLKALECYAFRDLFVPVGRTSVPAMSLNRVIESYPINQIDWLKIDSQGMDLRLIRSLEARHLDALRAIEVEPGLIHAYEGEDLFPETHTYLTEQGYWLSDLRLQTYPKVHPETLEAMASSVSGSSAKKIETLLKRSPTAAEARYLRDVAWLVERAADRRSFIVAFTFGLLDDQVGYAFDIVRSYKKLFGSDQFFNEMRDLADAALESQNNWTAEHAPDLTVRAYRHLKSRLGIT